MAQLNNWWLGLIIVGIVLVVIVLGVSISESMQRSNQDFAVEVTPVRSTLLIREDVLNHIAGE